MSMVPAFSWLPPEINSALIFGGAGSGPLFTAASAWDGLASDLGASASSFDSVIAGLTGGPWAGPASVSMAAAATPYVGWLSAAAAQAQLASGQAVAAATAFETALTATVHPAAVDANRVSLVSLIATNFLGQNTPAIAATEFDYVEMWAQDVGAMLGYHAGATSVASSLTPFSMPPVDLAGLASQVARVRWRWRRWWRAVRRRLRGRSLGCSRWRLRCLVVVDAGGSDWDVSGQHDDVSDDDVGAECSCGHGGIGGHAAAGLAPVRRSWSATPLLRLKGLGGRWARWRDGGWFGSGAVGGGDVGAADLAGVDAEGMASSAMRGWAHAQPAAMAQPAAAAARVVCR